MDDVRYSELVFLQGLKRGYPQFFCPWSDEQTKAVGLLNPQYVEMAAMLIEDHLWHNPREAVLHFLRGTINLPTLFITYRGLRRIEELRDLLKRDRVLEDFAVLLSIRYFRRDLEDALQRASNIPVSVLYLDMDDFGPINKQFGQAAGDVVMKRYLETVRDKVGLLGTAYRGVGDETVVLIEGQGHECAVRIAETIREEVANLKCEYKEKFVKSNCKYWCCHNASRISFNGY